MRGYLTRRFFPDQDNKKNSPFNRVVKTIQFFNKPTASGITKLITKTARKDITT